MKKNQVYHPITIRIKKTPPSPRNIALTSPSPKKVVFLSVAAAVKIYFEYSPVRNSPESTH